MKKHIQIIFIIMREVHQILFLEPKLYRLLSVVCHMTPYPPVDQ